MLLFSASKFNWKFSDIVQIRQRYYLFMYLVFYPGLCVVLSNIKMELKYYKKYYKEQLMAFLVSYWSFFFPLGFPKNFHANTFVYSHSFIRHTYIVQRSHHMSPDCLMSGFSHLLCHSHISADSSEIPSGILRLKSARLMHKQACFAC